MSTATILHTARLTLRLPGPQDFPAQAAFLASDRSRFVGECRRDWRNQNSIAIERRIEQLERTLIETEELQIVQSRK